MTAQRNIDGWRKQPAGHWYERATRSRASAGDGEIVVVPGPGYAAVGLPLGVVLDLATEIQSR